MVSKMAPCRCGGVFCKEHHSPEKHTCGFDYQAEGGVSGVGGGVFRKMEKI